MRKLFLVVAVLVLGVGLAWVLGIYIPGIIEAKKVMTHTVETEATEDSGKIMYACGIDRCKNSGEYGLLVFASGINVWESPDPNRGKVVKKLDHQEQVIVMKEIIIAKGSGGLWYILKGGGWINDLWLTGKPCNFGNIEKYSFDDC